ncbi:MAG: hypothetical protein CMO81_08670 [Waddliaceae bacterium]|nr:hypothetical protein [Waddliaceae bacterium]
MGEEKMSDHERDLLRDLASSNSWIAYDSQNERLHAIERPSWWQRAFGKINRSIELRLSVIDPSLASFLRKINVEDLSIREMQYLDKLDKKLQMIREKSEKRGQGLLRKKSSKEFLPRSRVLLAEILYQIQTRQILEMDKIYTTLHLERGVQLEDFGKGPHEILTVSERASTLQFYRFVQSVAKLCPSLNLMVYRQQDWKSLQEQVTEKQLLEINEKLLVCSWSLRNSVCQQVLAEAAELVEADKVSISFIPEYLEKVSESLSLASSQKEKQIQELLEFAGKLGEDYDPRPILGSVLGVVGFQSLNDLPCELIAELLNYYRAVTQLFESARSVGDTASSLNLLVKERTGVPCLPWLPKNEFDEFRYWYSWYVEVWQIYVKEPSGPVKSVLSVIDETAIARYDMPLVELSDEDMEDFALWASTYQSFKAYLSRNPDDLAAAVQFAQQRYRRITTAEEEKNHLDYFMSLLPLLTGDEFRAFFQLLQQTLGSSLEDEVV